ncbi:acyltransferase family protein [Paraburkholderia humisilvae]|uniref:O-acetyltransferase OatA n=2 Tax=Paraburkholderia humisilvae TaxID=627669 RepID=A0A6J5E2A9_9BURK|nr:acyltransferase [Paraburkholderia humisilvae]CAB3760157.1 O-acetyltransferase OatA [Paraburkholderia humisilvae]
MLPNDKRLYELDSLRGLAAVGIVCWHYTNMWHTTPLAGIFAPFYTYGLLLVDFFFVLSGFVLARAYWNDHRRESTARNIIERIARIYPLHFVTLISVIPIQFALQHRIGPLDYLFKYNNAYHFTLNVFLLNNSGLEQGFSFNTPAWSISTEMLVNLFFLLAITFRRRTAIIFMVSAWVLSAYAIAKHGLITNYFTFGINPGIHRTVAGFFIGVALYNAMHSAIDTPRTHARIHDVICITAILAVLVFMAHRSATSITDAAVSFILFPTIIASAIRGGIIRRVLRTPMLVYLGEISYSIYLTHFVLLVATLLLASFITTPLPYNVGIFLIGFLALTVFFSALAHRFIEIPGKRFVMRISTARNLVSEVRDAS